MITRVGGVPVEEVLPSLAAAGVGLLLARGDRLGRGKEKAVEGRR